MLESLKDHTKLRREDEVSKLIIFGQQGLPGGGQTSSHHHFVLGKGGRRGSSNITIEKNMGFVPMFSIAAAGIIGAATIYMERRRGC